MLYLFQMLPVLLFLAATRCKSASVNGYHSGNAASQFGELLKPPPLPPLSPLAPVPFHGGSSRLQRQNLDTGYHYQPPPPPPPPPIPPAEFKFPAPFYKQYNFNFVPPPQPFSTTPSPTLFQKVSGWLFSSQQSNYNAGTDSIAPAPVKKDCNPCNLVPWIPVIRYNVGAKNAFSSSNPTYGPPSPTAYLDAQKAIEFKPHPFQAPQQNLPQLSTGIPHAVYGPPALSHTSNSFGFPSSTYGPPISTYGPPSPTHTLAVSSPNALSSSYFQGSTSYSDPSSSFGAPSSSYGAPSSSYGAPSSSYGAPSLSYNVPSHSSSTSINYPSSSYSLPSSSQGVSSTSYTISSSSFATPSPSYGPPVSTTYSSVTPLHEPELLNSQLPQQNDNDISKHHELSGDFQLPKVTPPTTFKNSYGEPIPNNYISDIPYPVSATAAESMKIKTEVLPNNTNLPTPNASLALANPAPFTLNRGRNIHTLQPVALPNLSVSPLPPIFNARPFRPTNPKFPTVLVQGINSMQQNSNNVKIEQSVPVAEFTHSVDYPASFIQSPVIDVDAPKTRNETKAYRHIPNAFILNELRDIASQASEDHAAKALQDSSFESTGLDVGNELYESGIPMGFKLRNVPSNHKDKFADLRGVKDEDVDKYRTESNLQNIDSPLLYLKPSAPHKDYGNFVLAISTPINDHDYEIYDDNPTTATPQVSTPPSAWDESRNDYNEGLPPPTAAQESMDRPKIVQIIVPYTSGRNPDDWEYTQDEYYQARKMPSNTEHSVVSTVTESYNTPSTTTEESPQSVTDNFDSERLNTAAILNDLYDVKEPPFDIIKLQHTIDDWTEQEYSEHYKTPQRTRGFEKYAKQIPDEYFTTTMPTNYVTSNDYNYDFNDHEGSSSIQHSVTENQNYISNTNKPRKEYNVINRNRTHSSRQEEEAKEIQKLHIYTAASTFRSTTTTPAPWGKILTSISPLTKEKVYVVTSKPWREARNVTNDWYAVEKFESKRTNNDNDVSASDNLPFKSPRFVNRPSLGFSSAEESNSMKSDSSYGFSKSWYQSRKHCCIS